MRRDLLAAAAFGALAAACWNRPPAAEPARPEAAAPRTRMPGEYLVTLAPGADLSAIEEVYGRLAIGRVQDLGRGVFLVSVGEDPGLEAMEELRKGDPRIRAVQPNFTYRGFPR